MVYKHTQATQVHVVIEYKTCHHSRGRLKVSLHAPQSVAYSVSNNTQVTLWWSPRQPNTV